MENQMATISVSELENSRETLERQVSRAHALSPDLLTRVQARACPRSALSVGASGLNATTLAELGARTDAALALVALARLHVRRIMWDDEEWHCSLSATPRLPADLDDTADASHADLPLAILLALVRARLNLPRPSSAGTVIPHMQTVAACCDNYA